MKASLKACDEHLLKSSNKCIGASTLMNLLSNYCRKNDIKTSITVGIVGKNSTRERGFSLDNEFFFQVFQMSVKVV